MSHALVELLAAGAKSANADAQFPDTGGLVARAALWADAIGAGGALVDRIGTEGRVGIVLDNTWASTRILFGAWAAGLTAVSLPAGHHIGELHRAALDAHVDLIVGPDLTGGGDLTVGDGHIPTVAHRDIGHRALVAHGSSTEFIQHTSGSTGHPKGVTLDTTRLAHHILTIGDRMELATETVVSWLPLSHDMGLVGMLLCGWAQPAAPAARGQGRLIITHPHQFTANPFTWSRAFTEANTTITAAPDSGWKILARIAASGRAGYPTLTGGLTGSEPVRVSTLHAFDDATTPPDTTPTPRLQPCYGMAEACLAVTIANRHQPWQATTVNTELLTAGIWQPDDTGTAITACGTALDGTDIRISGGGDIGPIEIRSATFMTRYVGSDDTPVQHDGWYRTPDIGHLDRHGQLYVLGRNDDVINIGGRKHHPEHLEAHLDDIAGIRRCAIVADDGGVAVIVVARTTDQIDMHTNIRRRLAEHASVRAVRIVTVTNDRFERTTSGKTRRQSLTQALHNNTL